MIIPSKRDNIRNKYDFISFFNMRDERTLAAKLDNTFIEGRKIFGNIPKFQRKEVGVMRKEEGERGRNEGEVQGDHKGTFLGNMKLFEPHNLGGRNDKEMEDYM